MSGAHYGNALMGENYQLLDRRFTGDSDPEQVLAWLVVNMEIFIHAPLCLSAYVGIVTDKVWSCELEIMALTVQLIGTFVFVLPDFLTGCLNMVPHNVPTCVPNLTAYTAFFFYFGVTVNVVWV